MQRGMMRILSGAHIDTAVILVVKTYMYKVYLMINVNCFSSSWKKFKASRSWLIPCLLDGTSCGALMVGLPHGPVSMKTELPE